MSLRTRNGVSLVSQCRRACSHRPRSPRSSSPASPSTLLGSFTRRHLQLRVLRTSTNTKPSLAPAASSALNWSSAAHRTRHPPLSIMASSTTTTQTRAHGGHSHSHHHHHHDNTYLVSSNKKDAGVRITRIGLYVNLGMAVGKGFGGYVFNSQALVADAIHSLTDLVSDIMTLATVSWSLKPPSERFPSGYGKVESLGSLGVSGILLGGGALMGWAALLALFQQFFPELAETLANWGLLHFHGHNHSHDDLGPNINAAWLAGGSILIKEWLYRATLKVANERKSGVLASNAYHHRVDSLTAFVALLMILGSNVFSNVQWLDNVGGLVISLMVIQAGWGNTKSALLELADVGIDEEMKENVHRYATKALNDLNAGPVASRIELRTINGVKSGQNYLIDLELGVPGTLSVEQTKGIEDVVRERIGAKVRGVKKVRVRFVSKGTEATPDFIDEFIRPDVSAHSSPEGEEENHAHSNGHDHAREKGTNGTAKKRR